MLLQFTDSGIYCEQADVFIDPWKPVDKALITHGHSDHARFGMKEYLTHQDNIPIMKHRLGDEISVQAIGYGEALNINGVKISFHPAGHVIGSCQIRLEYGSEIWVVSGDYKVENDGISDPFEPVPCTHFITESTFGLPVFRFHDQNTIANQIMQWWKENQKQDKTSILYAYSLGKAQRLCSLIDQQQGSVFLHGAICNMNQVLINAGHQLPNFPLITPEWSRKEHPGALVIAPPSAGGSTWVNKFKPYSEAFASGWMNIRGMRRRRAADRGFVLSDHADWDGLLQAVSATGAENIFVTHGYTDVFTQFLREQGYNAHIVSTEYGEEEST